MDKYNAASGSLDPSRELVKAIGNTRINTFCPKGSGSGELKQFEMALQKNGEVLSRTSRRTKKCDRCNGFGVIE